MQSGNVEIVNKLILNGANVDTMDGKDGNSAMHRAAELGEIEILKEGKDITLVSYGSTLNIVYDVAKEININLLGVSVLTSFNNTELAELGFKDKIDEQILRLVKIADKADLYGVICSPLEIKMIKSISPNLKCFTPGIRANNLKDDQKRTMSADEAIKEGSDCLIIGRPITKGDPKKNILNILSSIK